MPDNPTKSDRIRPNPSNYLGVSAGPGFSPEGKGNLKLLTVTNAN